LSCSDAGAIYINITTANNFSVEPDRSFLLSTCNNMRECDQLDVQKACVDKGYLVPEPSIGMDPKYHFTITLFLIFFNQYFSKLIDKHHVILVICQILNYCYSDYNGLIRTFYFDRGLLRDLPNRGNKNDYWVLRYDALVKTLLILSVNKFKSTDHLHFRILSV